LNRTFIFCHNLLSVNLLSDKISEYNYTFDNCYNLKNIFYNSFDNVINIKNCFNNCSNLYIDTIHYTNTLLNNIEYAFYNCSNIKHIYIDYLLKPILPSKTFYNCINAKISLPNTVINTPFEDDFENVIRVCCDNTDFINNAILKNNYGALSLGKHKFQIINNIAPTCIEDGTQKEQCVECDYPRSITIPALGHNFNNIGTCERCGESHPEEAYDVFKANYDELITYAINELILLTNDELVINLYPEFDTTRDAVEQVTEVYNAYKELNITIQQLLDDNIGKEDNE
jgi:hypothetical protein